MEYKYPLDRIYHPRGYRLNQVGAAGFEPATSRTRTVHSCRAELRPEYLRDFTIDS
jgi:hypothetical protein